jgi:peptide/nickel transport system substrate-binding protein
VIVFVKQPLWRVLPIVTLLFTVGMSIHRLISSYSPASGVASEQSSTKCCATDAPQIGSLAAGSPLTATEEQSPAQNTTPGPTVAAPALSALAASPPPGEFFIQAVSEDVDLLNPLLTTNETAQNVADLTLPVLVGQDSQSGLTMPTELASHWVADATGRVYTFTLRSGITWSDGQPVTAQDVQFTYAALVDAAVDSPYRNSLLEIEDLEARDNYTVVVTFRSASCANLHLLRRRLLPRHLFAVDFSDLRTNRFNMAPVIGAGPFLFSEYVPRERIRLVRNPTFWRGAPQIEGLELRIITDPAEQARLLVAGEIDLAAVQSTWLGQVEKSPQLALVSAPDDGYLFLAMNLADPMNPQPGRDKAGALVAQPPHPILGDLQVRGAIAQGLDLKQLRRPIDDLSNTFSLPGYLWMTAPWAYDPDAPEVPFTPDRAMQSLTGAGWVDMDGDGLRERNGRPLLLMLTTNEDSPARMAIAELLREQLRQLGIDVQFSPLPFEQMAAQLFDQRFDLAIAGWENLGPDPATADFWHSMEDAPGAGLNFVSFQDAEVDSWLDEAAQLSGCAPAPRGARYRQVQQRIQEQSVYVIIGGRLDHWGYQSRWRNIDPGPWGWFQNVHAWQRVTS